MIQPTICCMFYLYIHHCRANGRDCTKVKYKPEGPGCFPPMMITSGWTDGPASGGSLEFLNDNLSKPEQSIRSGPPRQVFLSIPLEPREESSLGNETQTKRTLDSILLKAAPVRGGGGRGRRKKTRIYLSPIGGAQWYNQAGSAVLLRARRRRRREPGTFTF